MEYFFELGKFLEKAFQPFSRMEVLFSADPSNRMGGRSFFVPVFLAPVICSPRPAATDLFTLKHSEHLTIDKGNIGIQINVDKLTTDIAITG